MTTGKLNVWIREPNCELWNPWWVELEIKTCAGKDIFDIDPHMERNNKERLAQMYPAPGYEVKIGGDAHIGGFKSIAIKGKADINHIEVDVPPGCYVVRAWVCGHNEWTERAIVNVRCGEHACVNLIVPHVKGRWGCIHNVIIPFIRNADLLKIPQPEIAKVVDVLVKAGELNKKDIVYELKAKAEIAAGVKNEFAKKRVIEAKRALEIIK